MPSSRARVVAVAVTCLIAGGSALAAAPGPGQGLGSSQNPPSQPAPMLPKPDLTVQIKNITRGKTPNESGKHQLSVKADIQNFTSNKTWKDFATKVEAGGQPFTGSPHVVAAPLYGGQHQEKSFSMEVPPGFYTVVVTADWDNKQPETNERNNSATKTKQVPQGC
jgi:hypothetical protein